MGKLIESIFFLVGFLIGWIIIAVLPVYFLWNWLMPQIFGLTEITFWQALGVVALCAFLFKSTGSSGKEN